jgi:hypothetical protein
VWTSTESLSGVLARYSNRDCPFEPIALTCSASRTARSFERLWMKGEVLAAD